MHITGVTFVTTPFELSGRLVASAAFEPDVANFVDDITRVTDEGGYDLREYIISKKGPVKKIAQEIKNKTKSTLLAVARKNKDDDKWALYPNPDQGMVIKPGNSIILLGNEEEFEAVESLLGKKHGR